MENAFGQPQTVVVLGGTSEIAGAIIERLCTSRARTIVVAGRNSEGLEKAAAAASAAGATSTHVVTFDALDPSNAQATVDQCFDAISAPVDLVIVAVGQLSDQLADENDPSAAAAIATVNFTWPVAALAAIKPKLERQGTGRIVVLSSTAGVRVRRNAYLYGSAKAGLDRHCEGLADALSGTGVTVQVVRPGFVHTKMTRGLDPAPFSVDADRVAADTVDGLASSSRVIYTPGVLKWLFLVLRLLPAPLWRRLTKSR